MFKENVPKKGPLFREFLTEKPTYMGGTYPYPQHAMLPPGGGGTFSKTFKKLSSNMDSKSDYF